MIKYCEEISKHAFWQHKHELPHYYINLPVLLQLYTYVKRHRTEHVCVILENATFMALAKL